MKWILPECLPMSNEFSCTTERPDAPGGPLDISDITTSSACLTWQQSPYDGGSEITSYYIEKLEKGQKQWQKVAEVEPTIFTYSVENLLEGREYFFRVFALNAIGLSDALEASDTIFIKSPFSELASSYKLQFFF